MKSRSVSGRRRYRTPQDDAGLFVDPPVSASTSVLNANLEFSRDDSQLAGRRLKDLRHSVREFALREAVEYTQQHANVGGPIYNANTPWFVSGHQPEMFHPGVWFKNHLLEHLREKHAAIGLHLIVDNDLCTSHTLRVPSGSLTTPTIESVPFDDAGETIPYEQRPITSPAVFDSFGARAADTMRSIIRDPMVEQYWSYARQAANDSSNLGIGVSRMRHQIETSWGSRTLELPLSRLCSSREFLVFFLHFVLDYSRFVEIHNTALFDYRKHNRIRSRSHPVPALSVEDDWHELPFWVWQTSDPRRERLFVRKTQNRIELTDRNSVWRLSDASKTDFVLEQLLDAVSSDTVKIRPRAITTTMFCRLLLADVFIHGIGGAKYDELTDEIARRMQLRLPKFICATSTFRLPLGLRSNARSKISELRELKRQTRFHPERFISNTSDCTNQVSNWIATKRRWIESDVPAERKKERHEMIERANVELQPAIQTKVAQIELDLRQARKDAMLFDRLGSREFSFLLFPESHLRSRMSCDFRGGC